MPVAAQMLIIFFQKLDRALSVKKSFFETAQNKQQRSKSYNFRNLLTIVDGICTGNLWINPTIKAKYQ